MQSRAFNRLSGGAYPVFDVFFGSGCKVVLDVIPGVVNNFWYLSKAFEPASFLQLALNSSSAVFCSTYKQYRGRGPEILKKTESLSVKQLSSSIA